MTRIARICVDVTAVLVAIALVLFAIGVVVGEHAQQALIASKADQIANLRQQRDAANTRADAVTRDALAGIRSITCAQYAGLRVTSAFARLVYFSPTATADQRAIVAPYVTLPTAPKGCPTTGGHP